MQQNKKTSRGLSFYTFCSAANLINAALTVALQIGKAAVKKPKCGAVHLNFLSLNQNHLLHLPTRL
ncbi:MAG: hypothetical protein PHO66_02430, partial [Eubacteriales bacterium]|nr:hypothetical protein [Eubacteriales bacterium]